MQNQHSKLETRILVLLVYHLAIASQVELAHKLLMTSAGGPLSVCVCMIGTWKVQDSCALSGWVSDPQAHV